MNPQKLLSAALRYAELGYPVFPCGTDKTPLTRSGFKDASIDSNQIREWWAAHPMACIGLTTSGLIVIDIDGADNPWLSGDLTRGSDLAEAPTSLTPSGGRHHVFRRPEGVNWRCSTSKLAPKVDTRTDGGYIVVPPSARPEGVYEWADGYELAVPASELTAPPAWLAIELDRIHPPLATHVATSLPVAGDDTAVIRRAERYLDAMPGGVSGSGGHAATYAAAVAMVHGFALGEGVALDLLRRRFNPRCQPEWSDKELAHKVRSAIETPHERPFGWLRDAPPVTDAATGSPATSIAPQWTELIPLDTTELPPFPVAALPSPLGEWVAAESHATQTPPDLAALLALATCSACVARRVEVVLPGWREPTNLFVAVTLAPGNRKSAVFADATKPLREIEAEIIVESRPMVERARSERRQDEARLKRLEKMAAEKVGAEAADAREQAGNLAEQLALQPEPVSPRLIIDNATTEKVAMMLEEQGGRIASMSPEGGVFDILAGLYSKNSAPNFDVYLKAHAGDELIDDRVTRKAVRVERPALTCAYAIQPQVVTGLASNPAFRGRGLIGRFLYATPTSWIGYREIGAEPVPESLTLAYRNTVRRLHGVADGITLTLSPDALVLFDAWQIEIETMLRDGEDMESFRDWGAKLAGATLRIAAVLHAIRHGADILPAVPEIDAPSIESAIVIARYLIPHAAATMNLMAATDDPTTDDARYLWRWVERHGRREFTKTEAHHHGKRRFRRADDIDPALSELTRRGYIRPKPQAPTGPGRPPSPGYEANPSALATTTPGKRSLYSHNPPEPLPEPGFQE